MTILLSDIENAINKSLGAFATTYRDVISGLREKQCAFLACGSTFLGVKLALNDIQDHSCTLATWETKQHIVGISFSGNSAEVVAHMEKCTGSVLITGNKHLQAENTLIVQTDNIPTRCLPVLAYRIAALFMNGDTSQVYNMPFTAHKEHEPFLTALNECYLLNAIPVFCANETSGLHRVFASQYMECLKQPAFAADFPAYTHDLLWSLNRSNNSTFYFFHLEPFLQIPDSRYANTTMHIQRMGHQQFSFMPPGLLHEQGYPAFCYALNLLQQVAAKQNIDSNNELSFGQ